MFSYLPKVTGKYRFNSKLPNWFALDGKAEIVFYPNDLEDLIYFLKNIPINIPVQIIGAGSNVIIADEGIKGVVIKLTSAFASISHDEKFINIGAAALCANVSKYCQNFGIGGLEFLSGIPGSIGGAVAMNAGCYGSDISQYLENAVAVDYEGNIHNLKNSDFGFRYRGNKISNKFLFISARFRYQLSAAEDIAKKVADLQNSREMSQPIRAKTGGSTFKNPSEKKAWELIDAVGMRGASIGDAQISQKHCNFLVNNGDASASDLIRLGEEVRKKVAEKFAINLEWEVKILS